MYEKKYVDEVSLEPRQLIIYGKPKAGKTSLVSMLEDCCIVDLENGSTYVKGYKQLVFDEKGDPIKSLENLDQFMNWLIKEKPYTYVAFDTLTKLEEFCEVEATYNYMNSPQGIRFNVIDKEIIEKYPEMAPHMGKRINHKSKLWTSVLTLAQGYGYRWLRECFNKYFNKMKLCSEKTIFLCHIKDKLIETKSGEELYGREIDLTGKLKSITTSFVDTIGYLYRHKDGNTYLSFISDESVAEGSRISNLSGKSFLIGEWDKEKDEYKKAHWNKIYQKEKTPAVIA